LWVLTHSVISTHTSVISTRRVLWLHARVSLRHTQVWFLYVCYVAISTRTSVISTRRLLCLHARVWLRHARVWFIHAKSIFHTQSVKKSAKNHHQKWKLPDLSSWKLHNFFWKTSWFALKMFLCENWNFLENLPLGNIDFFMKMFLFEKWYFSWIDSTLKIFLSEKYISIYHHFWS
jgi:hypothetical protein